jgi:hypothetical protein
MKEIPEGFSVDRGRVIFVIPSPAGAVCDVLLNEVKH